MMPRRQQMCPSGEALYAELKREYHALNNAMELATLNYIQQRAALMHVHTRLLASGAMGPDGVQQQLQELQDLFDMSVDHLFEEYHRTINRICALHAPAYHSQHWTK